MTGIACAIFSSFSWGIGSIFVRLGSQGMNTPTGTFISTLSSLMLICPLALTTDYDAVLALTPIAVLWFSMIGLVMFVLGRMFNYTAIRYIGVGRATPMIASAPLFALIIAIVFTGETVNLPIVAGTLFIVVGIYLIIMSR